MSIGRILPSETVEVRDPLSGIALRQLTNYRAHSHHFYFTNPGWYDGGKRLLVASDRDNRTNLFGLDLDSVLESLAEAAAAAEARKLVAAE